MIDYQILALDLDGTLTNSQKQITPPTRAVSYTHLTLPTILRV